MNIASLIGYGVMSATGLFAVALLVWAGTECLNHYVGNARLFAHFLCWHRSSRRVVRHALGCYPPPEQVALDWSDDSRSGVSRAENYTVLASGPWFYWYRGYARLGQSKTRDGAKCACELDDYEHRLLEWAEAVKRAVKG